MLGLDRSAQLQGVRFGLPWLRFSERSSYRRMSGVRRNRGRAMDEKTRDPTFADALELVRKEL